MEGIICTIETYQFWRKPPVFNVDGFFCALERHRHSLNATASACPLKFWLDSGPPYPEVISPINKPFYSVAIPFRREGLETMALSHFGTLRIRNLLALLVVTVIWIYKILEFANFAFQVQGLDLKVLHLGRCNEVPEVAQCAVRCVRAQKERGDNRLTEGIAYRIQACLVYGGDLLVNCSLRTCPIDWLINSFLEYPGSRRRLWSRGRVHQSAPTKAHKKGSSLKAYQARIKKYIDRKYTIRESSIETLEPARLGLRVPLSKL